MSELTIIPVVDLRGGLAVRGLAGQRAQYQPLESPLVTGGDFAALMRQWPRFGFNSCYLADLDAIESGGKDNHLPQIRAYLEEPQPLEIYLDAGLASLEAGRIWQQIGVPKLVAGSETLPNLRVLQELLAAYGGGRLVLSLDTREGLLISADPRLRGQPPQALLRAALSLGLKEVILLQLGRVGTGQGLQQELILACRELIAQENPPARLIVGGGVASLADLHWLEDQGVDAVLIASLLHRQLLTVENRDSWHKPAQPS